MKKRIIALLLSLVMLTSLLTPTALATEGEEPGTTQEEVVKSNENERTDLNGATENGDAKDENQAPQQPTTGDEEQPTGQDEPKNEDETKGEDGQPGEEPKQPEQTGDDQPTDPEQGEETETPDESQEPQCTCGAEGEEHAEDCPLYEAQEEPDFSEGEPQDNGIVDFTDVAPLVEMDVEVVTPGILKAALLGAAGRPADPYPDSTRQDANGVETSKNVTGPDDNGNYTITMEAYTTGNVTVSGGTPVPADIVLVLDQSGSMKEGFGNSLGKLKSVADTKLGAKDNYYTIWRDNDWRSVRYSNNKWQRYNGRNWQDIGRNENPDVYITRLAALKNAVTAFVDSVAEKATTDKVEHRISIVGFASDNRDNLNYGNTELLSTTREVNYRNASSTDYKNSLVPAAVNGQVNSRLTTAIGRIDADGGTAINLGTAMAASVLEQYKNEANAKDRQKVVVIFTDGVPGIYSGSGWGADSDTTRTNDYANPAIKNTKTIGDTYGATVYTVGVFDGADGRNPGSLISNDGWRYDWDDTDVMNKFMHLLSSNYPNATSMDDTGSLNPNLKDGEGYFLSAGNAETLNTIFDKISQQIQSGNASIDLSAATVIKDVMSKYFTLPEGATKDDITIYTANATGEKVNVKYQFGDWDKSDLNATLGTDENGNQTVSVTGFDFNRNFVADKGRVEGDATQSGDFYGRKLIIQFQVKAKSEFWGGNAVPTNDPSSGIYNGDGVVENFEHPTADVKLNVPEITAVGKTIYYGNSAPTADDLFQMTVPADDWKTAYVKINTPEAGSISNEECGQYTGSITVEPTYEGKYGEVSKSAKAWVHVLEPSAEWEDITIYLGNQPKFTNPTSLKWADPNTGHTAGTPEGTAPTATSFAYEPTANAKYEDCTQVQPTFTLNGKNFSGNQFTVHVLKPTVTWTDCQKYYGESLSGFTATPVSVTWADSQDNKTTATAGQDAAPALSYDFTIAGGETVMPNKDVNVSVKTKINGTDVTSHTTYGWQKAKGVCVDCTAAPKEAQFRIHPLTCTLTISKSGWDTIDENQCFLFKYKRTVRNDVNATIEGTVTVQGNGSVRITGLPIGTYQVSEDENWSWRYQLNGGAQSATLTPDDSAGTLAFKNDRNNGKWLNGCSFAVNFWKSENEIIRKPTPNTTN